MASQLLRSSAALVSVLVLACASSPNEADANGSSAFGGAGGDHPSSGAAGAGVSASAGNQIGSEGGAGGGPAGEGAGGAGHPGSAGAPGVWKDITPAELVAHEGDNTWVIGQGLAIDPCDPLTLYWGNTPFHSENGGLFKSTDGGTSWVRVAKVTPTFQGGSDHLAEPLHVRIDPKNTHHLYAGDGVRGSTQGLFVSTDAGATCVKPNGLTHATRPAGLDSLYLYPVAAA